MRKCVFYVTLFSILLIGSTGFAQVLSGTISNVWRPGSDSSIWGRIGQPSFYLSWAAAGSINAQTTPEGSFSQAGSWPQPFGITWVEVTNGTASGNGELGWDARGIWLGASIPVRVSDAVTLSVRGEYLFPFYGNIWASANGFKSGTDTWTLYIGGVPFASSTVAFAEAGTVSLDASAKTRWFFLDAEVSYSLPVAPSTAVLAGVRYDRLVTNIGNVRQSNTTVFVVPASASITAELNSLSPYVGMRYSLGSGASGLLAVDVKGFPCAIFTSARYQVQNGYFAEFNVEYSGALTSYVSGSLFVRGDAIRASFKELSDFTRLFVPNTVVSADPHVVTTGSGEVATSIHWKQLSVGGSFTLTF